MSMETGEEWERRGREELDRFLRAGRDGYVYLFPETLALFREPPRPWYVRLWRRLTDTGSE